MKKNAPATLLLLACLLGPATAIFAQPFEIQWFEKVKSPKDRLTEQLLRADETGFCLLRTEKIERTDGGKSARSPVLEYLDREGDRLEEIRLPGLEKGIFCCAPAGDTCLLAVWVETGAEGRPAVLARRFDFRKKTWASEAVPLFDFSGKRFSAAPDVWFRRAPNGQSTCIYFIDRQSVKPSATVAVFDAELNFKWKRTLEFPAAPAQFEAREVYISNAGTVCVLARIYARPNWGFPKPHGGHARYFPDGRLPAGIYVGESATPYALAIFTVGENDGAPGSFYPETGRKFSATTVFTEDKTGQIYLVGLGSDSENERQDGFFVYQISKFGTEKTPGDWAAQILRQAALPNPARRALLSEKAFERKDPVRHLALRDADWTPDGQLRVFAERENLVLVPPGKMEDAVVFRFDSAFNIASTRILPKNQPLSGDDGPFLASFQKLQMPDGSLWFGWNEGRWPQTNFRLARLKKGGEPEVFDLDFASRSGVSPLPLTFRAGAKGRWWFVAESEYGEKFRIGSLVKSGRK